MNKFLTWNFFAVVLISVILIIIHELGHYLAYRVLGYQATVRKSIFVPGIDPKETIEIPSWKGVFIALSGFIFSAVVVLLPLFFIQYQYWLVLLIGGAVGSGVDAIWAVSMLGRKTVIIYARK